MYDILQWPWWLKIFAVGEGYLGFDSRACQNGHSVANGSPPLRWFFEAAAMLSKREAAQIGFTSARKQHREYNEGLIFLSKKLSLK